MWAWPADDPWRVRLAGPPWAPWPLQPLLGGWVQMLLPLRGGWVQLLLPLLGSRVQLLLALLGGWVQQRLLLLLQSPAPGSPPGKVV